MAVAVARLPPPPVIVTVGAVLNLLPEFVMVIAVTLPPTMVAVAVAPLPSPPVIVTVGAEV
ncbi:hypothetical protein D3C72_2408780 [compost metagenome]